MAQPTAAAALWFSLQKVCAPPVCCTESHCFGSKHARLCSGSGRSVCSWHWKCAEGTEAMLLILSGWPTCHKSKARLPQDIFGRRTAAGPAKFCAKLLLRCRPVPFLPAVSTGPCMCVKGAPRSLEPNNDGHATLTSASPFCASQVAALRLPPQSRTP